MSGTLYIVSTPIGNLMDVSHRSLNILSDVDCVLCEDSRITKRLFNKYNISNKLKVINDINENSKKDMVVEYLLTGKNLALVSDAGTPCISDPGYRIVNSAKKNNIKVVTIPGPSSVIAAISISGLPTDNFYFQGFLPKKKGRKTKFEELLKFDCSIVLFESPKRVLKTLNDILNFLGDRTVALCRELTKVYEEVKVDKVSSLIKKKESIKLKGEYVIVISKKGYKY